MLYHVLRVKRTDIQACKGKIYPDLYKQYLMLFQKSKVKNESRKWVFEDVVETVDVIQQCTTASLQSSCKNQYIDRVVDTNQMCIEVGFFLQ